MAAPTDIRLLVLDVDGVLTDGGIVLDARGEEAKRFHVRDGTGLRVWMRLGGSVALITGRRGGAVAARARELEIEHLIQGSRDKGAALEELLERVGVDADKAAAIGDDLPDLPLLRRAGYPMAVADAAPEVQAAARFVTSLPGGHGAVREAIEHLLRSAGRWDEAVSLF